MRRQPISMDNQDNFSLLFTTNRYYFYVFFVSTGSFSSLLSNFKVLEVLEVLMGFVDKSRQSLVTGRVNGLIVMDIFTRTTMTIPSELGNTSITRASDHCPRGFKSSVTIKMLPTATDSLPPYHFLIHVSAGIYSLNHHHQKCSTTS